MTTLAIIFDIALFIGGYVASIYTWTKVKVIVLGAQAEADRLKAKANAILDAVKK